MRALALGLAACNPVENTSGGLETTPAPSWTTVPPTEEFTTEFNTEEPTESEPASDATEPTTPTAAPTEQPTTTAKVTTTVKPTTTTKPTTTKRPTTTAKPTTAVSGKDPGKMNKEQLVAYFNEAANNVRKQKPKLHCVSTNKIEKTEAKGLPTSLVTSIVNQFMDGKPVASDIAKDGSNQDKFLARESAFASNLRTGDVTGYNVAKSGANYVITLNIKDQTNPVKGDSNSYGRVFDFMTPQGLLDKLSGTVSNSPENVTLNYNSGKVELTVTPDGKVIKSVSDFKCTAYAPKSKVSFITLDITAYQSSHVECEIFW
jgi:hypothetical protein